MQEISNLVVEPDKPKTFKEVSKALLERLKEIKPETKYSFNDKGNGELFADLFAKKCRYNVTAKEWYVYDGKKWTEDTGSMITSRYAKKLSDTLTVYAASLVDESRRESYLKHVMKLGQLRYRNTMLQDARDKYFIHNDDLDKDLYLLNCQNGVMNLKSFEFRLHNPDDLMSKITNITYDPSRTSPLFEKFISDVMKGNKDKINYLQKLFGYALTGDTRQETCYILYGSTTRNGKSTLVETYAHMLGNSQGYALTIKPETLAQKQNNDSRQASGDIARLKGCRFLNASEPQKKMLLDAGLLKSLLGRDSITARHLHEREFEFMPVFKLFMNVNFLPVVQDDTLFSSGRINVISFDRHFEPHEQDKTLKDRLWTQDNISGVFNWCIEGLRKYYLEGANPPEEVKEATEEYHTQSDKMGSFISEVMEKSNKNCKAGDVYEKYKEWCTENGYGVENKRNFFSELKSKGIFKDRAPINGVTIHNVIIGYVLSNSTDLDLETDNEGFVKIPEQLQEILPFN